MNIQLSRYSQGYSHGRDHFSILLISGDVLQWLCDAGCTSGRLICIVTEAIFHVNMVPSLTKFELWYVGEVCSFAGQAKVQYARVSQGQELHM